MLSRQSALALSLGTVLLFGTLAIVQSIRQENPVPLDPRGDVQFVSIRPDSMGHVTLEWRDGSARMYRVLKSNNPKDFSSAESHRVRGNRWTDSAPGVGQVTYYRVE